MIEIKMPQLGQTSDEVRIIKWFVKEGQEVKRGEPLCEVETDKVTMEFESFESGTVLKINIEPDTVVTVGTVVAVIGNAGEVFEKNQDAASKIKLTEKTYIYENWVKEEGKLKEQASESDKLTTEYVGKDKAAGLTENIIKTKESELRIQKETDHTKTEILSDIGSKIALGMFRKMIEIREFEERIKLLFLEGKMPGTIHQYIGQEACAVGVCTALNADDIIASTHRPHGHAIARGLSMDELMAELYGKTTGCCKGKGGSMHVGDITKGMLPAIAIVGGNLPVVVGMALSFKLRRQPRVAVSFFGDGASNEGAFHESLNMASIYNIPAVFVCENNGYGASTSIKLTYKLENIADRACSYGMRSDISDGMDVLDVYTKAKKAIDIARDGQGPTLLELKTFRLCGHSRRDPCNYMSKDEIEYWKTKDPIASFENLLIKEGLLSSAKAEEIRKIVDGKIDRAIEFARTSPDPKPEDTYKDLYVTMEVPR
ncbi:MAG: thiamine pyrophosphate-dependent enzyme [Actinobacteria bacterium]|nr:thiamine pyrophosphate-dependent enzyme [Actinomycetota bacterium]